MFGNPALERLAIEATYEDSARVYRPAPVKGADGITRQEPRPLGESFRCGLSDKGDRSYQAAAQTLAYDRRLFCPPETDVRPGDTVEVTRFGETVRYLAVGAPMRYATHLQLLLKAEALS